MSDSTTAVRTGHPPAPLDPPEEQCDVVMKGGITSGVVYPKALRVLGTHYRLRGIGGASAGAIGAALGAAAELGRAAGGFAKLDELPDLLGDGKLADLFQPQRGTRQLLDLMLVATGSDRSGPRRKGWLNITGALAARAVRSFWLASLVGVLPGVACVVLGAMARGVAGWALVVAGVLVAVTGWLVAILVRLYRLLTVQLPANRFGICSGLSEGNGPGFTDWLTERMDAIAGLEAGSAPLTFGHLWKGSDGSGTAANREIDLRLITTCLSEGTPFEMPFEARRFFFDPDEWAELFPEHVMRALLDGPTAEPAPSEGEGDGEPEADEASRATRREREWRRETEAAQEQNLVRLPDAEHLPVIVATRLSLSFPLLISAIPLYTVDRRSMPQAASTDPLTFNRVWFTDGGFCSNFPVQLFDAALASRPTFAINLGSFDTGVEPDPDDQTKNISWARDNRSGVLPPHTAIADSGFGAVAGFASAAFNAARNWQDNSQLRYPGYRDRIVRVLQSKTEGGMNLRMDAETIDGLADRGEVAATVMVEQFTQPRYGERTGWDNHRWVRYRALLSVLPDWIASYRRRLNELRLTPATAPSYKFDNVAQAELAEKITDVLSQLDRVIEQAHDEDPRVVQGLLDAPRPRGRLRRVPQI